MYAVLGERKLTTITAMTGDGVVSRRRRFENGRIFLQAIPTDRYPGVAAFCFCAGVSESQLRTAVIRAILQAVNTKRWAVGSRIDAPAQHPVAHLLPSK